MAPLATFQFASRDQPGLVARLAGFFFERGLNIVDSATHSDPYAAGGARFFLRMVADLATPVTRAQLEESFGALAASLGGTWSVGYSDRVPRVALLVTREAPVLYDLILRQQSGELQCEIPLIVSNRAELEAVAAGFRIPFYALPVTAETKPVQERELLALIKRHHVDLLVLARYMQILSEAFLREAPVAINIHHGFLPAFQGAKPYHQAHERGVKLIGATAHYVTGELDQGPIIEQDVARVTHEAGPDELVRVGRDVERVVLARAVRAHLERRVFVEGRRTIVL